MKPRFLGVLALVTLVLVVLWAALLIGSVASGEVVETLEQALQHVRDRDAVFTLNYVNAMLVTLSATALFGALHVHFAIWRRPSPPSP